MLGARFGYVAVLYDLLAATPILLTLGVFISARYGSGSSVSVRASLRRVLRLPPLWGVAAGIGVNLAGIDGAGDGARCSIAHGQGRDPGHDIHGRARTGFPRHPPAARCPARPRDQAGPFPGACLVDRLAGSGLSGQQLTAATIEGAMPVMVLSLVIADEFELDVPLAAAAIAVSTVMLFFTMPVMMKMLV